MAKLSTTLRRNLVTAYDEAEELHTNLTTMSDEELIEVKDVMIQRTLRIMKQLDKYVTDDDLVNL